MRVYTATNKETGRKWLFCVKVSWNRRYFQHVNHAEHEWFKSLGEARADAERQGKFEYIAHTINA